jgi:hypothetical protein
MQHSRRPRRTARHENVTSHAGWLTVSLVLGIMVIVVASSSVVPKLQATEEITDFVYVQRYEQVFESAYDLAETDAKSIDADVANFLNVNGLPPETVIVQAQFIGGYTETTELMADGINRATTFQAKIEAEDPTLFTESEVSFDGTNKIFSDKVVVRFRFGDPVN